MKEETLQNTNRLNQPFTCFVVGETSLLIRCVSYLLQQGQSVKGIFSADHQVNEWAKQQGIICFNHQQDLLEALQKQTFDYLFSIINSWIIPPAVLQLPQKGAINFHDSPLPRYAGVNATVHALRHAERQHGISWHEIASGIDTGDILQQVHFAISADDTALSLNLKCYEAAYNAFAELVQALAEGRVNPIKQDLTNRSYYSPWSRPEAACVLNWSETAEQLDALVRALDMGTYRNSVGLPKFLLGGHLFIPVKTKVLATDSIQAAGTLLSLQDGVIHIATTTKDLAISQLLSIEGETLPAAEWAQRYDLQAGQQLSFPNTAQRQKLTELDQRYCRHERYWTQQLAAVSLVDLPHFPNISAKTADLPAYTHINYPQQCSTAFLSLSFAILLARLTQSYSLTLGFSHPALRQELAGNEDFFAAQIPLNFQIDAQHTFSEALQSFQQQLEHVDSKGTYLYDLRLREPALTKISFTDNLPSIVWGEYPQAPLATESNEKVLLIQTTKASCYWPAALLHLAGHFQQLVTAIIQQPELPIYQLPLLDEAAIQQLGAWNNTVMDYPKAHSVVNLFEQQVEKTPDKMAVIFANEQFSYRELNHKSNQLAHYLLNLKNTADNCLIAVCMERSLEMLVSLLAILKIGAAYLPIDPNYPAARIGYMLKDSAAPLLLTQTHLQEKLHLNELEHDCNVICLDKINFSSQSIENPCLLFKPEALAYVIYTSGSTGMSKGVMVGHQALAVHIQAILQHYKLNATDIALQFASFSFDASIEQLFVAWLTGACAVVVKTNLMTPVDLLALMKHNAITVADLPPAYWQQMLEIDDIAEELSALRMLILGGEALPCHLAHKTRTRFPALSIFNAYGPTEAVITPTVYRLPTVLSTNTLTSVSIGQPRANTRIYILDARHQPQPLGISGELCIASEALAQGYLNRPELTAEKFIVINLFGNPTLIYKSGDLARWLADGNLEYLGRIDQQVKLRGYRIELGEIESLLRQHPAVKEALVTVYEADNNKRLVAYLTTDVKSDAWLDELKNSLKSNLPDYMIPSHFTLLERLPLTANGKIDHQALPAPDLSYLEKEYLAPASAIEIALVKLWEKELNLTKVGVQDNFFELGGNSLIALQLVAEIQNAFKLSFGIHDLFDKFTVRKIADYIEKNQLSAENNDYQIQRVPRDGALMPVVLEAESLFKLFSSFDEPEQLFWLPFCLKGDLDFFALQQSFDEMIRRHEPLRTSLIIENNGVFQRIEPFKSLDIPMIDLTELNPTQQRDKIIDIFSKARFKPLKPGYMIDAFVLKQSSQQHIFAYSVHYFSFDDQAISIFNREFSLLYESFRKKIVVSLPELSVQYADYAVWIKKQFEQTKKLPVYGKTELLQLEGSQCPCDKPPSLDVPPEPVVKQLEFDAKTVKSFELLNSSGKNTELIIFTTVLQILLHRLSGKNKILIMADFNYRTKKELKGILGHYAMSAYICTDFSGDPTFNEMLERTQQSTLDFYKNTANLSYCKKILDDLIAYPSNTPFSDVCCLAVTNPEFFEHSLPLADLQSEYQEFFPYTFYIHFYLHLTYSEQRIFGSLNYDLARFNPETPHNMICQFRNILNSVAKNPHQPISEIVLSSPEDKYYEHHDLSNDYTQWQF